MFHAPRAINT